MKLTVLKFARSLWGRIVLAQVATALLLAIGIQVVAGEAIHAISDDLTQRFLERIAEQSMRDLAQTRQLPAFADTVSIYLERNGRIDHLSGPIIDDVQFRPQPLGRPIFEHGPHSDFYATKQPGTGLVLVAAEDRRHPAALQDDVAHAFLRRLVVVVPVCLVLSTLVSLLAIRHAMASLRRAAKQASIRDRTEMAVRLDERDVPTEVLPLVHATNAAFDRLEAAYDRERAFSSTVVHELRTSLSTILLRSSMLEPGRVRSAIEAAGQKLARMIDQILELRRITVASNSAGVASLDEVVKRAADDLEELVVESGRSLVVETRGLAACPFLVPFSPASVALRNLILNAHLHSVAAGTIVIVVDHETGALSVCDDGPGISAREDADGRVIYSRSDGVATGSSGLGIAIIRRVLATIGGHLSYQRSSSGGTVAILQFEAQPEHG